MSSKTNNNIYKTRQTSETQIKNFNLTKSLVDFLWSEPFYSRILRSLSKVETTNIPTAGVATVNDEITLWWNRKFLAGLTNKQVKGLLKHECLHLVFGHTTERRKEPHLIWNYATDLAINSTIPEDELPEGGLIPGKQVLIDEDQKANMSDEEIKTYESISNLIASLPRNKTSEYYFEKLSQNEEMQKMAKCEGGGGGGLPGFGFDDHEGWDSLSDEERELISAKIKELVKDAAGEAN